jgi:ribonuclease P protein component
VIVKKKFRLKKDQDFKQVIAANHVQKNRIFVVYSNANEMGYPRVGISVSKKVGSAVTRNRIRRQIRMMVDQIINLEESVDLLIIVRSEYLNGDFEKNSKKLYELIDVPRRIINE